MNHFLRLLRYLSELEIRYIEYQTKRLYQALTEGMDNETFMAILNGLAKRNELATGDWNRWNAALQDMELQHG